MNKDELITIELTVEELDTLITYADAGLEWNYGILDDYDFAQEIVKKLYATLERFE